MALRSFRNKVGFDSGLFLASLPMPVADTSNWMAFAKHIVPALTDPPYSFSRKMSTAPFSAVSLALTVLRGYQLLVRPLLAGTGACRFVPSCSDYATEAIHTHGVLRGSWLALKRVLRCRPFGGHGLDQVP